MQNEQNKLARRCRIAAQILIVFVAGSSVSGCVSITSRASPDALNQGWVSTWGASPTMPVPNAPSFENQTLRLIVHTSVGGNQVRVRIANTFSAQSLVLGTADIGVSGTGASVVPETNRELTFNGLRSIKIPAGAFVVSDPLTLTVPAMSNLSVSIFLPDNSGPITAHPLATQISYVSGVGNFAANSDAAAFVTQIQTWPFLSSVEVKTAVGTHAVVTFGDSITDGYKSTVGANLRWPDHLAKRLAARGKNIAVVNEGISGNRLLHDAAAARPIFGPNALSRFDRDVLSQTAVSHVVVLIGINDIGNSSTTKVTEERVNSSELIGGLHQLVVRAHAKGLKIIGATLTPFEKAAYSSADGEVLRQALNQWIRSSKEFDGVIDFDAAVRDPAHPAQFLATYDSGDHLHPSDAGYKAMGEAIDLSLFDH